MWTQIRSAASAGRKSFAGEPGRIAGRDLSLAEMDALVTCLELGLRPPSGPTRQAER